jgi:ParB family chromosome partitioning protein
MSKSRSSKANQPYAQLNNVASLFALTRSTEIKSENIEDSEDTEVDASEPLQIDSPTRLKLEQIVLPEQQPRRYFDPEKLAQLAKSIQEHGILEPLLVRPQGDKYELVAGERRFRAAQQVGLSEVPVVIHQLDDRQALQVALIENLQREDLNAVEETEGILRMLELTLNLPSEEIVALFNWRAHQQRIQNKSGFTPMDTGVHTTNEIYWQSVEAVFRVIGRFTPESFRTHRLPLLKLPVPIMQAINSGQIEYSKARLIARIKDETFRDQLLRQAIEQGLSRQEISNRIAQTEVISSTKLDIDQRVRTQADSVFKKFRKARLTGHSLEKAQYLLSQLEALLK